MNIIELKNISKSYGSKKVLDNFSLEVKKNEMIAIVGSSGCGKSTLLNILGLIESFDEGEYILMNKESPKIYSKKANEIIRKHISYLFQNFALIDYYSVEENLMLALKYTRLTKLEKETLVEKALKDFFMGELKRQKIYELSGGEQQRIAIIIAILKPGELVLADEPTGSLDINNRNKIIQYLLDLKDKGKTIIVVTHDEEVAKQCDRIIQLT